MQLYNNTKVPNTEPMPEFIYLFIKYLKMQRFIQRINYGHTQRDSIRVGNKAVAALVTRD